MLLLKTPEKRVILHLTVSLFWRGLSIKFLWLNKFFIVLKCKLVVSFSEFFSSFNFVVFFDLVEFFINDTAF